MKSQSFIGILLFLFFLSLYAFTMEGTIRFGDEGERYLTAQSLVERHDLAIRIQPDLHRKIGVDGRNYSSYELGSILPLVPFYAAGAWAAQFFSASDPNQVELLFVGLFNPVVTALTVWLLYVFCQALGQPAGISAITAGLFGIATIALPYSKALEREPFLGLTLLFAVYAAYRFYRTNRYVWLWAAGLGAGACVFAKVANVILLPPLALYLALAFWRVDKPLRLKRVLAAAVSFGLAIAVLVGIQAASNWLRFGSLTDIGLASTWGNPLDYFGLSNLPAGLSGMLFSSDKSIFLYSMPVLLCVPAGFVFFQEYKPEALLVGSLIAITLVFNAMNSNWSQTSWWGNKYLVPLIPLLILPVGSLLVRARASTRPVRVFWSIFVLLLGLAGIAVQVIAGLVDDRAYLDVTGLGIDLSGALDFLRHGAFTSLTLYSSPTGFVLRMTPYGMMLVVMLVLLGLIIARRIGRGETSGQERLRAVVLLVAFVLAIELVAFLAWVVAPYPRVLAARGDTEFVAGEQFRADGRTQEAVSMYALALDHDTRYMDNALARLDELNPRTPGESIDANALMVEVDRPPTGLVAEDYSRTISGDGSLKISIPGIQEANASARSDWIEVLPGTTYELSGWLRVENIYGSGYGVVGLYEDDGVWKNPRNTDIVGADQTTGWRPFRKTITTLSTTRRVMLSAGLWKTYGTLWIDSLELARIPNQ